MGARIRPRQVGDPSETIGSSFWTITRGTSDPWPKAWGFRPTLSKDGRLSSVEIKAAEIALIVEGIDLAGARCRPRWEPVTLLAAKNGRGSPDVPDNSVYVASERRKYRIRRLHTYREGHAAYVMKHGNRDIAVACGRQGEGDPPARRVIHAIQRGRDGAMLVSPAMGMYGTWFVATETELARCWRLRRRGQRVKFVNPWTKEPILDPKTKKPRMVMQDDEIEIFSDVIKTLPHVQVKWLDDKCVGRFFGPAVKVEKIGWDRAGFLFRVPDRAVAQLVERKPRLSLLVEDWEANVHDLDGPYVQDIVDEGTAKTLLKLAKRAAKVGSSFCGWYF